MNRCFSTCCTGDIFQLSAGVSVDCSGVSHSSVPGTLLSQHETCVWCRRWTCAVVLVLWMVRVLVGRKFTDSLLLLQASFDECTFFACAGQKLLSHAVLRFRALLHMVAQCLGVYLIMVILPEYLNYR